jgi:hypothetical protein
MVGIKGANKRSTDKLPNKTMKNLIRTMAIVIAACATSAFAVPTLTIFDGTTTVTIMDGGAGDSCAQVGCVTWIGSVGVWNINVDTGLTKPVTGTSTHIDMDLAFAAHSTGSGTLSVTWSDDGYMLSGGLLTEIGGTTGGTVVHNTLVNGSPILSDGPFGPGAFSGTATGTVTLNPADVFSLQVVMNHTGSQTTTGDCHGEGVPEGGSAVALLGMALFGLGLLRRKFAMA